MIKRGASKAGHSTREGGHFFQSPTVKRVHGEAEVVAGGRLTFLENPPIFLRKLLSTCTFNLSKNKKLEELSKVAHQRNRFIIVWVESEIFLVDRDNISLFPYRWESIRF